MKLTTTKVTMLTITDVAPDVPNRGALDPIRVITEDIEPGKGRIIVSCYDAAWTAYWGAMGNNTVRQFVMGCDAGYIADNLIRSMETAKGEQRLAYLERIAGAIKAAFRAQEPRVTHIQAGRRERMAHANELIKAISEHGRRFFWNADAKRVARIEMDDRNKLWWIDDYKGSRIYMDKIGGYEHRWRGFSHGGTLQSLAIKMRIYIKAGERIHLDYIAQSCWGYDAEAALATRKAAALLPIIKQ